MKRSLFIRVILLWSLLGVVSASSGLAQKRIEMTQQAFYSAWSAGQDVTMKFARIITTVETSFTTGGEIVNTSRSERDGLGNQRDVYSEGRLGGEPPVRREGIHFEGKFYCRNDGQAWMTGLFVCGMIGERVPGNIFTESFNQSTVTEKGKRFKALRRYVTFDDPYSFNKTPGQKSFYEKVSLIDSRGRLIRESTKAGPIGGKKLDWTYSKTYVFDPKIKIQAPKI